MIILGIETSCDDTAVSMIEGHGGLRRPGFRVLAHVVSSQTAIHAPWGGIVPNLAKREHAKNLVPVLEKALGKKISKATPWGSKGAAFNSKKIEKILAREPELLKQFLEFIPKIETPKIDAIAVTVGPGLEPALWAGINLARALALVWQKKLISINHIEGHIVSVLNQGETLIKFPALTLIISGGHTELVVIKDWFKYKIIGQTRDDAAGEAFDKVARLLDLPYPGGPAISELAEQINQGSTLHPRLKVEPLIKLPRPMINSPDFDFSFSGLKTAVFYLLRKIPRTVLDGPQGQFLKSRVAREFQQAVIDVLLTKTIKAMEKYKPQTLIIAGGVSANQSLRQQFIITLTNYEPNIKLLFPEPKLSVDNATMIAMAGYLRLNKKQGSTLRRGCKVEPLSRLRAQGRLVLK